MEDDKKKGTKMEIDMGRVAGEINDACDKIGGCDIGGIKLESGDHRLLDVREGDFDEHVSMQPSAIAFFGVLRRQAERHLANKKRAYDRWHKKKYQEAKHSLETKNNGKKVTIADIESFMLINHEPMIEKWEDDIENLQAQYDTFDVWYDSWKQKSFSLREHGQTISDEKKTMPYLYNNDAEDSDDGNYEKVDNPKVHVQTKHESSLDRVRKMRRKKNKE